MPQEPLDPRVLLGLSPEHLPQHIAIIMDGNGRWANQHGLARIRGHRAGAESVRSIVSQCARLTIPYLTLYSFSSENWRRPAEEVSALMELYAYFLARERDNLMENNVRLLQLGHREGLPGAVLRELDITTALTRDNTGLTLCLALNYGSRQEIVDAIRGIAEEAAAGRLRPQDIDESLISRSLYTADIPDPDLLIRTAGEYRISNFLLWQISYAEFYVCSVLWPDFRVEHLHAAIQEFARRDRRFGRVRPAGA